ncbi:MAG: tRNA (adenosine(37)-N6)-threonylcarbamoyltransferase complex dimerization subunit type 1 TsaB [Bacteroidales bacterium]|jgi:tRNA threonylcarbamoyladenosine biosynthesis protein TsaB|nr:tRNA (adenosine(37)-N6)-threonylcarbamoyltransferase complex dimerization subunit type 1 TsaB [Bacteroidales bacterium]
MILCIETATDVCSVALCSEDGVLMVRESTDRRLHASMLTVHIGELLSEAGITAVQLEAVAVSKGPGSYTGLRIGVSAAKGIAYGASLPLAGIETTLSMTMGMIASMQNIDEQIVFCPMIDARRMEVYNALYDYSGKQIKEISADIITESSFETVPEKYRIVFFGNGAAKCRNIIKRQNVEFIDGFSLSAAFMHRLATDAVAHKRFEDVAYFEPFYLKDFVATTQRKNIFG